ncbi:dispanin subfamily A member 2b-like [Pelodytes ibericus]
MENSGDIRNASFNKGYSLHQNYQPLKEESTGVQNVAGYTSQATMIAITPTETVVKDHLVWSIFNTAYLNFCCLGLIALVFSVKSRDRKLFGDLSGAKSYGSTAFSLNLAATIFCVLMVIVTIILFAVGVIRIHP